VAAARERQDDLVRRHNLADTRPLQWRLARAIFLSEFFFTRLRNYADLGADDSLRRPPEANSSNHRACDKDSHARYAALRAW
jgi:hypothetical protein